MLSPSQPARGGRDPKGPLQPRDGTPGRPPVIPVGRPSWGRSGSREGAGARGPGGSCPLSSGLHRGTDFRSETGNPRPLRGSPSRGSEPQPTLWGACRPAGPPSLLPRVRCHLGVASGFHVRAVGRESAQATARPGARGDSPSSLPADANGGEQPSGGAAVRREDATAKPASGSVAGRVPAGWGTAPPTVFASPRHPSPRRHSRQPADEDHAARAAGKGLRPLHGENRAASP